MRRLRGWRTSLDPRRVDGAIAAALAVLWQLELWAPSLVPSVSPTPRHHGALALAGLLVTLPLAARRTAPLAACGAVMGASVLAEVVGPSPEGLSEVVAVLLAANSVAAHEARPRALAGLALVLAANGIAQGFAPDDFAFGTVLFGGAWAVGRTVRAARERSRELEALTGELAHEREANARLAVSLERTRIARELHDVVAHAVSVMVVQAGGVRGLLAPEQEDERRALAVVESTGREAMGELRRMVGVLRAPVEGEGLAPPPGLAHVEALVEHVRDAGLPVRLTVAGEPQPLPPGLELSAYRIVQEALTNTLKHAGPARAEVAVRYGAHALELDVLDDGAGPRANGTPGHGLAGMRERVALFGGRLEAGPGPDGGFRIVAELPTRSGR